MLIRDNAKKPELINPALLSSDTISDNALHISELISKLQVLFDQHGDLPVYSYSDGTGPSTYVKVRNVEVGEAWFSDDKPISDAILLHWW